MSKKVLNGYSPVLKMRNEHAISLLRIEEVMQQCIDLGAENQTPFGAAVIARTGELMGIAANRGKTEGPLSHAEMNVLRLVGKENCEDAVLVTTCEPCPMCAGGAIWSKISSIFFGASIHEAARYMHQIHVSCEEIALRSWNPPLVIGGVLGAACIELFERTR